MKRKRVYKRSEETRIEKKRRIQKTQNFHVVLNVGSEHELKDLTEAYREIQTFDYMGKDVCYKFVIHDQSVRLREDFCVRDIDNFEIVGASENDDISIRFDNFFIVKQSCVRFENLKIRIGESLILSDCDKVEFVNCRIHGNVIIRRNSKVLMENIEIFNSPSYGILMKDSSFLTLRNSIVKSSKLSNIVQTDYSSLRISDSFIHSSSKSGIWVKGGERTEIRNCSIYKNRLSNVILSGKCRSIQISNSRIYKSRMNGIMVRGRECKEVLIEGSEIKENEFPNIYIKEGEGNCEDGLINSSNDFDGSFIFDLNASKSNITIRNNKICSSKSAGIWIKGKSSNNTSIVIKRNSIFDNEDHSVVLTDHSSSILRENKIYNGKKSGICFGEFSTGTVYKNEIYRNQRSNIILKDCSCPTVEDNKIYKSRQHGIEVNTSGKPVLKGNCIFSNSGKEIFCPK